MRSKQYSILVERVDPVTGEASIEVENTGKGVPGVIRNSLCFFNYADCIVNNSEYVSSSVRFTSSKHRMNMIEEKRVCLRSFDDKRFMLGCGIHSKPHGHYSNTSSKCGICS